MMRTWLVAGICVFAARPATAEDGVATALERAGQRRPAWEAALKDAGPRERRGLVYLIESMPDRDLETLDTARILEETYLAYDVAGRVPWESCELPEDVFLDAVLPYACATEERHPWRREFVDLCLPLVEGAKTRSEGAARLNSTVFGHLGVRYSTERRRPDQSAAESIEQGKASCTGLSILLVYACRAVGIPARIAGIPSWPHKPGNHTWVEIWDRGWHYTGAAEPDPDGLDRGWFSGEARLARRDSNEHSIYAATWRRTGTLFPLVWAPDQDYVYAENVTDRYASGDAGGLSGALAAYFAAKPEDRGGWQFDPGLRSTLAAHGELEPEALERAAWDAYAGAPIHDEARADFESRRVRSGTYESPYTVREVGTKPDSAGWGLVIAMHGGGGVAKEVNDDQWRIMQIYYLEHPDAGGYLYVALRAPTDAWNGFYTDYVYPLVENLVRQFVLFGDVDPDRVYLIGYSHGGYGAFAIGPKIPYRFAAIHASAAAPTEGQTSPKNLRNTVFSYMVGEHDSMYGRLERCRAFDAAIRELKGGREDIYPVTMEFQPGHGHGGLPDRDKLATLLAHTRDPLPRDLVWELTDGVVRDFYWLSVGDSPAPGKEVRASCHDNLVSIDARGGMTRLTVWLDSRLVDFSRPVTFEVRGEVGGKPRSFERTLEPDLVALCDSVLRFGDPAMAFTARVDLDLTE